MDLENLNNNIDKKLVLAKLELEKLKLEKELKLRSPDKINNIEKSQNEFDSKKPKKDYLLNTMWFFLKFILFVISFFLFVNFILPIVLRLIIK